MDVQRGEQGKAGTYKEGLEPRSVLTALSLEESVLWEKMTALVPLYWSS